MTDKKERKAIGKQERARLLQQRARKKKMRLLRNVVIGVVVLAAIAVGIVVASHNKSVESKKQQQAVAALNQLATQAGCNPVHTEDNFERTHITVGQIQKYTTTPPIGGPHYFTDQSGKQIAPAPTGVHTDPIQNEIQVHNLEHGQVGIQYNGLSASLITQLKSITESDSSWIFLAPYPAMREKLAFTSWGNLVSCPAPNSKAIDLAKSFVALFKEKAPEHIAGTPA
ncbi:MAG: DUF3105 domain-containing protein [Actinomycetota bacterium]